MKLKIQQINNKMRKIKDRIRKVRERFSEISEISDDKWGLLILNQKNLFYVSGVEGFWAKGLLTPEEFILFLNENDCEIYQENFENIDFISVRTYEKNFLKDFKKSFKFSKIFVDNVDGNTLINLKKEIENIEITDVIEKARAIKDDDEIENIKKACDIARKGIEIAEKFYNEGTIITEHDLAAEIEYFMKKCGSEGTFEDGILLASGKRTANIHAKPSKTVFLGKHQNIILVDLGAKFNNYFSDLTRTFTEKSDNEIKRYAELIRNLELTCIDKIYAGMKISEISNFAEKEINKSGFKFFHSLGHGVGLDVHEQPFINSNSDKEFEENMTFTIEPGIYKANKFGIRFEDTCVIKNGKARIL